MAEPSDIRDETCTNLSILLNLLIRNIRAGDTIPLIATKKQAIQIEEILVPQGIRVWYEPLPEDLLVTISKPD